MFLEAQFGADAVAPVERPRMPTSSTSTSTLPTTATATAAASTTTTTAAALTSADSPGSTPIPTPNLKSTDPSSTSAVALNADELAELSRLHALGLPVPGICIRVDKLAATVWLEDLSVECGHAVLRDRVGKVVERAVECVSGLWG